MLFTAGFNTGETMTEQPKQPQSVLPWLVAAIAVFALLKNNQGGGDLSDRSAVATVAKTLPNIRAAYRDAFLTAADLIEQGKIKDQEAWLKHIAESAGAKQREALDAVYKALNELDLPASFEGKEKEIAKINRDIGGAW
jgi:hypothetical protein